ncbi:MAG: hypothetical protein IPM46_04490 [Flavobacteriales bacterium]|nr:hypothetical protein [Flavobacteriales bacterium]
MARSRSFFVTVDRMYSDGAAGGPTSTSTVTTIVTPLANRTALRSKAPGEVLKAEVEEGMFVVQTDVQKDERDQDRVDDPPDRDRPGQSC